MFETTLNKAMGSCGSVWTSTGSQGKHTVCGFSFEISLSVTSVMRDRFHN